MSVCVHINKDNTVMFKWEWHIAHMHVNLQPKGKTVTAYVLRESYFQYRNFQGLFGFDGTLRREGDIDQPSKSERGKAKFLSV